MLPACNRGAGANLCAPDVCKTPPPLVVGHPQPYTNRAAHNIAVPFSPVVFICGLNALHLMSKSPVTTGDEKGIFGPGPMRVGAFVEGNPIVFVDGIAAVNQTCPASGNQANAQGAALVPDAVNVFYTHAAGAQSGAGPSRRGAAGAGRRPRGAAGVARRAAASDRDDARRRDRTPPHRRLHRRSVDAPPQRGAPARGRGDARPRPRSARQPGGRSRRRPRACRRLPPRGRRARDRDRRRRRRDRSPEPPRAPLPGAARRARRRRHGLRGRALRRQPEGPRPRRGGRRAHLRQGLRAAGPPRPRRARRALRHRGDLHLPSETPTPGPAGGAPVEGRGVAPDLALADLPASRHLPHGPLPRCPLPRCPLP